jgi:phytoene dehydrogenase-like protein
MAGKAVVSTIDIDQTFLKYVGEDQLEQEFTDMIHSWQWEYWSLCNLHLAMAEPPVFKVAEADPEINNAFLYVLGYENMADLKGHWEAMRTGGMPENAGYNCCFPSVHDPFQAPFGRATGLISQMAPFDRDDGGSERWLKHEVREETAKRQLAMLGRYAPNVTRDKVLWTYPTTPADIENKFANMVKGSYKQGAYHPLQMGYLRPNQDCSQYRTPVKNLYLGGASVAPGGMVRSRRNGAVRSGIQLLQRHRRGFWNREVVEGARIRDHCARRGLHLRFTSSGMMAAEIFSA